MVKRHQTGSAGFTLMEVIVTMGVLSIIAGATIISLAFYIPNLRLKSVTQEINVQIQKARLEAIRSGRSCHVEFYTVVGGKTCSPLIWLDGNVDGVMGPGEEFYRLEVQEVAPGQWEFERFGGIRYDSGFGGGDGVNFPGNTFIFNRRGISDQAGTVHLLNARGRTREVLVTLGGAIRVN